MMNVLIRADASEEIGSGHIMRCLCLAKILREAGAHVVFLGRALTGHMQDFVESEGFDFVLLGQGDGEKINDVYDRRTEYTWQQDAEETISYLRQFQNKIEWLVVDHYGLDEQWENRIREHVNRIMVIDDLANRMHACEILLDQNIYKDADKRYTGLVPVNCHLLLGPEYALIREEFTENENRQREDRYSVRRILVMFGGMDPDNVTGKALRALKSLELKNVHIDVVAGARNPNREALKMSCEEMGNTSFYIQPGNIADLMAQADLAIGAGGITILERIYMGLPTIAVSVAENQEQSLGDLDDMQVLKYLGRNEEVSVSALANAVREYMDGNIRLRKYEINRKSDFLRRELQGGASNTEAVTPV